MSNHTLGRCHLIESFGLPRLLRNTLAASTLHRRFTRLLTVEPLRLLITLKLTKERMLRVQPHNLPDIIPTDD